MTTESLKQQNAGTGNSMVQVSQEHTLCGRQVGGDRGWAYAALDRLVTWLSRLHHLQPWLCILGAEMCPLQACFLHVGMSQCFLGEMTSPGQKRW